MSESLKNSPGSSLGSGDHDHLKLVLKALDVGLWSLDLESGKLDCDARWYAIVGMSPGSVQKLDDFRGHIHPEDMERATTVDLEEVSGMIARDERYHNDFRIVRPDGEVRMIRSVACLLIDPDSGHCLALGCVADVTSLDQETHPPVPVEPDVTVASNLTERELECLRWVSLGKTAWETATIMDRSQRTVEFHLANATRRLSATNKIHAAVIAVRNGLI